MFYLFCILFLSLCCDISFHLYTLFFSQRLFPVFFPVLFLNLIFFYLFDNSYLGLLRSISFTCFVYIVLLLLLLSSYLLSLLSLSFLLNSVFLLIIAAIFLYIVFLNSLGIIFNQQTCC